MAFERDTQVREDLANGQKLKSIKVYQNGVTAPIKEIELVTSYFISPTETQGYLNYSVSAQEHALAGKRLRLDQVVERGNGLTKPPYRFTYSATALPYKTSYNRDHWGYANGALNNTLTPSYQGISPVSNTYITFAGANREPNAAMVGASLLQQIQYPSGGKTTFAYEANDYGNMHPEDLNPWRFQAVIAYQRSFTDGTLDTQGPGTFTAPAGSGAVGGGCPLTIYFKLSVDGCSQNCQDDYTYVQIRQLDGSYTSTWSVTNTGVGSFTRTIMVPPGKYEVSAKASTLTKVRKEAWIEVDITAQTYTPVYKKLGAGVRIASITDAGGVDAKTNLVRTYAYAKTVTDDAGTHMSSQGRAIAPNA